MAFAVFVIFCFGFIFLQRELKKKAYEDELQKYNSLQRDLDQREQEKQGETKRKIYEINRTKQNMDYLFQNVLDQRKQQRLLADYMDEISDDAVPQNFDDANDPQMPELIPDSEEEQELQPEQVVVQEPAVVQEQEPVVQDPITNRDKANYRYQTRWRIIQRLKECGV